MNLRFLFIFILFYFFLLAYMNIMESFDLMKKKANVNGQIFSKLLYFLFIYFIIKTRKST